MEYVETTPQPAAAEPADGQETLLGQNDILSPPSSPREENMEGDGEQGLEEVPKRNSHIRFRKKSKQPKKLHSKGLCLHFMWTAMLDVTLIPTSSFKVFPQKQMLFCLKLNKNDANNISKL